MLPLLSHIETLQDINFWITTDKVVGCSFRAKACDIETEDGKLAFERLTQSLRLLDSRVLARLELKAFKSHQIPASNPRFSALRVLGHTKKELFVHLEYRGGLFLILGVGKKSNRQSQFDVLLTAAEALTRAGLNLQSLLKEEVEARFKAIANLHSMQSTTSVEEADGSIGVFRMMEAPIREFSLLEWIKVQDTLPLPYEICLSFRRMDEARAKIFLERSQRQTRNSSDVGVKAQYDEVQKHLLDQLVEGEQLFEMELIVLFRRAHLGELSRERSYIRGMLARFTEFDLETFGVIPSYLATLPGNEQHVTFIDKDKVVAALAPVFREGGAVEESESVRALSVYRKDRSLYSYDLFNRKYNAFNTVIVGTSGRGKSVLTGLLSTSLLHDPKVCIIKLDVGGSHSKEVELFGGEEIVMSLNKPSGLTPFSVIRSEASHNDKLAIVAKFVEGLLMEEGELTLTKSMRAQLEAHVGAYIESNPEDPNLNGFYEFAVELPRRELLGRWARGGLYEAAFASRAEAGQAGAEAAVQFRADGATPPRRCSLRYYNFSEIFTAADPEFARAGIAAVLAEFNALAITNKDIKIVLICDETPFFVRSCFEFFKFTTANVRKYGHAVVLISQLLSQLVVNDDAALIDNSPQRFLFSIDGEESKYQNLLKLSDRDMLTLKGLRTVNGVYSEALFQTGEDSRKVRIEVTREEYWRLTTSKVDKEKLVSLMKNVKGLSLNEAIRCLSAVDL